MSSTRPSATVTATSTASRPRIDLDHFSQARANPAPIPRTRRASRIRASASSASSTSAWISTCWRSVADAAARLAVRHDRSGGEDRSGDPAARAPTSIGSAARPTMSCRPIWRGWDVGLMPFAINEFDASSSARPRRRNFSPPACRWSRPPITDVVRHYGDKGLVEIADEPPRRSSRLRARMSRRPKERVAGRGRPACSAEVHGTRHGSDARADHRSDRPSPARSAPAPLPSRLCHASLRSEPCTIS